LTVSQLENEPSIEAALPVRVFMVDDNRRFLKIAAQFLATDPQLEVVGMAFSGHEALEQIALLQPDLVLMDVALPDINGLELTRHLKKQPEALRIIILTSHDDPEYHLAAEQVKADGFVAKADLVEQLRPLIHRLFNLD
jgi:DNA-binding NarL/FixJ family response regulator